MEPSEWIDAARCTHQHRLRERAMLRRQFLGGLAGMTGAALASRWQVPSDVSAYDPATGTEPRPIPQVIRGTHHFGLGHQREITTVGDFIGIVGGANLTGTGIGTNTKTGATTQLNFSVDNRFLIGDFIAQNGQRYSATFGVL